ncbi:hypothetical protein MRX96_047659, partial [Rhipicephalus microplus]
YRRRSGPEAPTHLSCAESALRYGSFVVLAAFSVTATLLVTPALLLHVAGSAGCGDKCFSLEDELLASIDHSVHPCDDFYRHVCGGWESVRGRRHDVPVHKYRRYADRQVINTLLGRAIPRQPESALDKAAVFLLHCLGQSSLGLGLPLLWGFHVGRDPVLPTRRNTLYVAFDKRVLGWISDVQKLDKRRTFRLFLRRAAEVIGGVGQSYALMIADVAAAHKQLSKQVTAIQIA